MTNEEKLNYLNDIGIQCFICNKILKISFKNFSDIITTNFKCNCNYISTFIQTYNYTNAKDIVIGRSVIKNDFMYLFFMYLFKDTITNCNYSWVDIYYINGDDLDFKYQFSMPYDILLSDLKKEILEAKRLMKIQLLS